MNEEEEEALKLASEIKAQRIEVEKLRIIDAFVKSFIKPVHACSNQWILKKIKS